MMIIGWEHSEGSNPEKRDTNGDHSPTSLITLEAKGYETHRRAKSIEGKILHVRMEQSWTHHSCVDGCPSSMQRILTLRWNPSRDIGYHLPTGTNAKSDPIADRYGNG